MGRGQVSVYLGEEVNDILGRDSLRRGGAHFGGWYSSARERGGEGVERDAKAAG